MQRGDEVVGSLGSPFFIFIFFFFFFFFYILRFTNGLYNLFDRCLGTFLFANMNFDTLLIYMDVHGCLQMGTTKLEYKEPEPASRDIHNLTLIGLKHLRLQ